MKYVYLSLGSNLGNRYLILKSSLKLISIIPTTKILKISDIYETKPFKVPHKQPNYLNMCILILTHLSPFELLKNLQNIEFQLGRKRLFKNSARTLDIDILLMEHENLNIPDLSIPHPRMFERDFVKLPLSQIFEKHRFIFNKKGIFQK